MKNNESNLLINGSTGKQPKHNSKKFCFKIMVLAVVFVAVFIVEKKGLEEKIAENSEIIIHKIIAHVASDMFMDLSMRN